MLMPTLWPDNSAYAAPIRLRPMNGDRHDAQWLWRSRSSSPKPDRLAAAVGTKLEPGQARPPATRQFDMLARVCAKEGGGHELSARSHLKRGREAPSD